MLHLLKNKTNRFTRTLRYLKRKRVKTIRPVRISKSELAKLTEKYEEITRQFVFEMEQYRKKADISFPQTERFTDYEILSFNGDRMGKVFRKDGAIYRGIYHDSADDFRKMWNTGLLQILSRHGWIPETEISGYYTEEYPIILRHQSVEMNASKLWSYQMIREASIRICLINQIARRVGFTLHDGHMNNVTFHRGEPVFTDIGSFVRDRGQKTVCSKEIVFTGCYRCVFTQLGNYMLSRSQPYDEANNMIWITPRNYDDLTEEYRLALRRFRAYHRFRSSYTAVRIIHRMFDCWDVRPAYLDALFPAKTDEGTNSYPEDAERIAEAVREAGIEAVSAVDVGGMCGRMSKALYQNFGMAVTDCETDDAACDRAKVYFEKENIPGNVFAFHYLYGCDPDSRQSVKADLATCADITGNVFSVQQYRVDSLLNSIRKMTKEYAVVTYYPYREKRERYIPRLTGDGEENVQYFIDCFEMFFEIILKAEFGDPSPAGAAREDYCLLLAGRIKGEALHEERN